MRIIFVGSNPSIKSSKTVPFWHDTKSMAILTSWFEESIESHNGLSIVNVSDLPTENNRPLKISEIKASLVGLQDKLTKSKANKVVALGKTAEKALTLLGVPHYAMPHPSGLNRKLNDKAYVAEKINGLKSYLKSV
jgi:uracil-DNA glycosylase